MKVYYFSFLLVFLMFLLIPGIGSAATVIQPYCYCGDENNPCSSCDSLGYRWSESTLYIELPGEYVFADVNFPQTEMRVDSSGVTVDGRNANLIKIVGQPDLNLQNIKSDSITECYTISNSMFLSIEIVHGNIENSEIFVDSDSFTAVGVGQVLGNIENVKVTVNAGPLTAVGVGQVLGNIENMQITVHAGAFTAVGIGEVLGDMENVEISVNSGAFTAVGLGQVHGNIENAKVTVSSGAFTAVGIGEVLGDIEDLEISVNSGAFTAVGIGEVLGDIENKDISVNAGSFSVVEMGDK